MRFDALYELCASLPHATLSVQWGDHDVFKVGGKIFAIVTQDIDVGFRLSIKADAGEFDELCGEPGVRPAPYLARAQWVQIVADNGLGPDRLRELVQRSHGLVLEKLPAAQRRKLDAPGGAPGAVKKATVKKAAAKAPTAKKVAPSERAAPKAPTAKKVAPSERAAPKAATTKKAAPSKRAAPKAATTKKAATKRVAVKKPSDTKGNVGRAAPKTRPAARRTGRG
jgi:predicted DNA-binding protein (MmcQ/YjbR family)